MPNLEEVRELEAALQRVERLIDEVQKKWEALPTIDEVEEYAKACGAVSVEHFLPQWEALPTIDEVEEYAKACRAVSVEE